MILLSTLIKLFQEDLLEQYQGRLLPSHYKALTAMADCRTEQSPLMQAGCEACDHQVYFPHSCGHRSCPHCQNLESQQWLERQLQQSVPAEYFMVTFTLPSQFRPLAWGHQRQVYDILIQCAWETLRTFSENDKQLQGIPGAIAVLHTHARNLDYHVHVHFVIPAAAIDREQGTWRTKAREGDKTYLFNHNALATVFRAKLLDALSNAGLSLPKKYPKKWVVDCAYVGSGEPALIYLGRYLYRGVIQEKDIVACHDGKVTYRWKDSDSGHLRYKTVEGTELLWKLLQHVLPKRFRRARNFGFLHPNSKLLTDAIRRILCLSPRKRPPYKKQRQTMTCPCCGGRMVFIRFRIPRVEFYRPVALI